MAIRKLTPPGRGRPVTASSLSVFGDKSQPPSKAELAGALSAAAPAWEKLVAHVTDTCPKVTQQWNFAGAKFGWSMRLRSKDRIVLYLIPQAGRILVGIVLGARALAAVADTDLPAAVLEALAAAPRHAEGTGVRLPVATTGELPAIFALVALKMGAGR